MVNALWSGGAEAMTIQGQRVIATTGIKCVGNTVVLHGVPYAPPYVISAIGDPEKLQHGAGGLGATSRSTGSTWRRTSWATSRGDAGDRGCPAYRGHLDLRAACRTRARAQPEERQCSHNDLMRAHPGRRQLRLLRLQPGPVPGPARRRGRGLAQRRRRASPTRLADAFDGILLSPGPGTPEEAGVCVDMVQNARPASCRSSASVWACRPSASRTAASSAARPSCCTARRRWSYHEGDGVLAGLPTPVHRHPLPLARDRAGHGARRAGGDRPTPSGVIMAVRHRNLPVEGVQFHPESVLTEGGHQMLANWLASVRRPRGTETRRRPRAPHVDALGPSLLRRDSQVLHRRLVWSTPRARA